MSSTDVNVLSWSHQTAHLLATGADDGQWAVWDLRQWKPATNNAAAAAPKPVASYNFHKEQITSIEWHPTDDSIVAVAAGDNTLRLVLNEFVDHYHRERNHQGIGHVLIEPGPEIKQSTGRIQRRKRLGGLLSYYHWAA